MPFKLGHINVRSLIPKFNNFKEVLLNGGFDCLGVTESWVPANFDLTLLEVEGYHSHHLSRGSRGGGIAVYVRSKYNFSIYFEEVSENVEHLWIKLNLFGKSVVVGIIYRPGNDFSSFLSNFEDTLAAACSTSDFVICTGDFNVNAFNILSSYCTKLTDCLETYCLTQIINEPTRVSPYSSTLIDYVITPVDLPILDSGVINYHNLADHSLVFCNVNFRNIPDSPILRTYRDYRFFNYNNFMQDLLSIPWEHMFYINNINDKLSFLNNNITALFDFHAPYVTRRFSKPHKPWITDNVKFLISLREDAFRRSQRTGVPAHWDYYKSIRNYTTFIVQQEKKLI